MKGFLVASPRSGAGKTLVTCALLLAAKQRGMRPHAFKCGPDFIDPAFHRSVLDIPSENLDSFFLPQGLKELFRSVSSGYDPAVIEGVMGLFDGADVNSEHGSTYEIAEKTGAPIVLCIDAKGTGRSILPLIRGFLSYDEKHLICGVFLNRVSSGSYERLKPLIEKETGLKVFGFLPESREFIIESRHLGLKLPSVTGELYESIKNAAAFLEGTAELDELFSLELKEEEHEEMEEGRDKVYISKSYPSVRIALARDAAFSFIYEENLRVLRRFGAVIVPFSPIHDSALPENAGGVIFPGGYPELFAAELSGNTAMLGSVRRAMLSGMPSIAECGGFLYLHSSLITEDDAEYPMAGILPFKARFAGRSPHFGYLSLREKKEDFLPEGEEIRGHEFHYFESESEGEDCAARKKNGKRWDCVHKTENGFWGFPHLYYASNPAFALSFTDRARKYLMEENSRE
ncbi:MAG: cobyrinate a,c-diamide synthase [Lachnospiraceae bacterium]|nr:cobyrinate a,c-diamide synthase [Lachnospiraceae bacterium]